MALSDLVQGEERVQFGAGCAQLLLDLFGNGGVIDEALAGSLGAVVALLGPGSIALLGDQFERRLEEIGVETNQGKESGQGLSGDESAKALVTGKPSDNGAVLLFDEGLVVGAVGA